MTLAVEKETSAEGQPRKLSKEERRELHRQARRDRRKRRRALINDLLRVFIIAGLFVAAALVFPYFDVEKIKDVLHPDESLVGRIKSYAIFILIATILQSLGFFRWVVCVAAGGIYGAAIGIIVAMTASLLGAFGTYLIGSSMLTGVVRRRLKNRHIEKWKGYLIQNPFMGTLYMRLFPGSNALMTSLICGTCRINLRSYFLANFVGFAPQTLIFCIFGSGATKAKTEQLLLGIGLFVVVCVLQWFAARWLKKSRPDAFKEVEEIESS